MLKLSSIFVVLAFLLALVPGCESHYSRERKRIAAEQSRREEKNRLKEAKRDAAREKAMQQLEERNKYRTPDGKPRR